MRTVPEPVKPAVIERLQQAVADRGIRKVSKELGAHHSALTRALCGDSVSPAIAAKLSKVIARVRTADDFETVRRRVTQPHKIQGPYSWTLEKIRQARDAQIRGSFALPVALAESSRTDDAIFNAYHSRIAPQDAIGARITPHQSARGKALASRAASSAFAPRSVIKGIHGTLVNHGIAIGFNKVEPNADGTALVFKLTEWPLEFVQWNNARGVLQTRTRDQGTIDIVHGDGLWTVFQKFDIRPWTQEACILPASFVWAAHAEGLGDWASTTHQHGLAKIVGELPQGTDIVDATGNLTPAGEAFLNMLTAIANGDTPAGIIPSGAKAAFLANPSNAWQVFAELITNREKAAARIYNGTDAILGSVGGAPGVDIAQLFGVATTKLQGDLECIEQALDVGFFQPWAALNAGDSRYAPSLRYEIPDPDADSKREERFKNRERLTNTIKAMRDQKLEVTQDTVNTLAEEFGVVPPPTLASIDKQTATLVLAPTDIAKVVRIREARMSQGLPALGDARDDMTITELDEAMKAKAEAPAAP